MVARERLNRRPLGFQVKAALALPDGADPQIGDKGGRLLGHGWVFTV
jgi:hypothetical protein